MLGFLYAWPAGVNQHQIQGRGMREYNYPEVQLPPASAHFGRTQPGSRVSTLRRPPRRALTELYKSLQRAIFGIALRSVLSSEAHEFEFTRFNTVDQDPNAKLQTESFFANIGADTAENGSIFAKILTICSQHLVTFPDRVFFSS